MGRKNKTNNLGNSLIQKLESGENIIGLTGYIALQPENCCHGDDENKVYPKVKVKGLKTVECGLQVVVSLVSGMGEVHIEPCQWLDQPEDIEARRASKARFEKAREEYRFINDKPHYIAERKNRLADYAEGLAPEAKVNFNDHLIMTFHKGDESKRSATIKELLKPVLAHQMGELTKIVVGVNNNLNADEVENLR